MIMFTEIYLKLVDVSEPNWRTQRVKGDKGIVS